MNPTESAAQPAVTRTEHFDRVAALGQASGDTRELRSQVHDEVQEQLALLETEVRGKIPGLHGDAGQTHGEHFFLCSYRTFALPHSRIDPVVAGITVTLADQGVVIDADISGEQTGDLIVSVSRETVGNSKDQLIEAARASAQKLCQSVEAIIAALADRSRLVD